MGDDDKGVHDVVYVVWEFCKDKRGRLGFHQKVVSNRVDSEAFRGLVCPRCKHFRICPHGHSAQCVFYGRALRYKPCGNFAPEVSV
jgi:hypothetical protein